MPGKRIIGSAYIFWLFFPPLRGGTGSPHDGFLSFMLLFAFLVCILGILQLVSYLKRKIREILEDMY